MSEYADMEQEAFNDMCERRQQNNLEQGLVGIVQSIDALEKPLFITVYTEAGHHINFAIEDISYIIRRADGKIAIVDRSDGGQYAWIIIDPCAPKVWEWASKNAIDLR